MIHILHSRATSRQIAEMLNEYESMIKIVVDVRRRVLAGGGNMQSDCESALLNDGSAPDDLWGANWYPAEQRIAFESLINTRPRLGIWNALIRNKELRKQVEAVTREILGGVK